MNFSVTALRAILKTVTLPEIRSPSLKQNHLKNLVKLYSLLPAESGEQLKDFVMGLTRKKSASGLNGSMVMHPASVPWAPA